MRIYLIDMPRVTRAAMRSHVIEAAPSTPLKDRIPLSDITSIVQEELLSTHESDASRRVMKKTVVKAKKAKGTKRGHKKGITKTEVTSEVLDDENQSEMSSAVDEACGELLKESTGGQSRAVISNTTTQLNLTFFQIQTFLHRMISTQIFLLHRLCKLYKDSYHPMLFSP